MRAPALLALASTALLGLAGGGTSSTVTVTMGRPTEYSFTLSRSSNLASTVTFKVSNQGALPHQFKVCTTPVAAPTRDTCSGVGTSYLAHGKSATLTVTFSRHGTYEFLSGAPGQAANGMKGLLGVGVTYPATPTTATTVATSVTLTTSTGSTTTTPTTGAALFNTLECSMCHSASEAHAAGAMTPNINQTHSGGPFPHGALTPDQLALLTAFVNSS